MNEQAANNSAVRRRMNPATVATLAIIAAIASLFMVFFPQYAWLPSVAAAVVLFLIFIASKPYAGTLILFFLLPMQLFQFGSQNIKLWQLLQVALTCVVLAGIAVRGKAEKIPMGLSILALVIVTALSAVNSISAAASIRQSIKFLLTLCIILTSVQTVTTRSRLRGLVALLMIEGGFIALWGLAQAVLANLLGLQQVIANFYAIRPTATFTEPGWFGVYSSYMVIMLVVIVTQDPLPGALGKKRGVILLSFLSLIGFLLSHTRGSWLGMIGTLLMMLFLDKIYRSILKWLLLIPLTFFILYLVFPSLMNIGFEKFTLSDPSSAGREFAIKLNMDYIKQHPVIGNGIGTWGLIILPRRAGTTMFGGSSFNMILAVLFDTGILGFIVYLHFYVLLFAALRFVRFKCRDPELMVYSEMAVWGLACLLINSLFNPSHLAGLFWGHIALCVVIVKFAEKEHGLKKRLLDSAHGG